MKRWFAAALLALPALYAIDHLAFRIRGSQAFGAVHVRRMYQVKEKNKKFEYFPLPPEDRSCTYTLFPQNGLDPACWWLQRHAIEITEM